jgi:TfoX/Sxy family transcriptional regulator of competence genes
MPTDANFVQFVVDQIDGAGEISFRKMFGEYALYCNKKVVALICDNQLFMKPTEGGRKYIGEVVNAPAFPGAKPSFLIEDRLEDRVWLTGLIRITARELPEPMTKKKTGKPAQARNRRRPPAAK